MTLEDWYWNIHARISKYRKMRMERQLLLMEQYKLKTMKYGEIPLEQQTTQKFERGRGTQRTGSLERGINTPTGKLFSALGRATTGST